jgi:hypothetical protein
MTGFDSKRRAAQDKLDDDADTLLIVYQRGFADGKKAAQPEQEPVKLNEPVISAWILREVYFDEDGEPLMHRSPPAAQRPWVGLTDDEAKKIYSCIHGYDSDKRIARAVEAKLKESNT